LMHKHCFFKIAMKKSIIRDQPFMTAIERIKRIVAGLTTGLNVWE
jgi:hypothetical protein